MKSIKKISIIWVVSILAGVGILYAADTIIQNIIGGQVSDTDGSYGNRSMTIDDGDLKFINEGGDGNTVGDYFTGYYFDPAYGVFEIDSRSAYRLKVTNTEVTADCESADHVGYKLQGYSYNSNFGFMNFNESSSLYSYICLPVDSTNAAGSSYLGGYAYSPYIGLQSLSGISLDSSVDFSEDHDSEGRYIKVEGVVASENNTELLEDQFDSEVRILGKLTKSSFRKDIHQKIYPVISNLQTGGMPDPYVIPSGHLGQSEWPSGNLGEKILNNTGLYFRDTEVHLGGQGNIKGNKTLVVEGADVYITGNIENSDNNGILGIIALQKNNIGGNIFIDPTVTDIHAAIYADRSVISYNGLEKLKLDGSTPASSLANQLYIFGSVFSENTIGSSQNTPPECPFYVTAANCDTTNKAMMYDLNFLRKYILVQPVDTDGNPIGDKIPQFRGVESRMGDSSNTNTETQKPGYRKYPVIIEYNSSIQQSPPPFFN